MGNLAGGLTKYWVSAGCSVVVGLSTLLIGGCGKTPGTDASNTGSVTEISKPAEIASWVPESAVGPNDTKDFICTAFSGSTNYNGKSKFTDPFVRLFENGTKFKAIANDKIRVASSSADTAKDELNSVYKARMADRDKSRLILPVTQCVIDEESARGVALNNVSLDSYRPLKQDVDFTYTFLALVAQPLDSERVFQLTQFGTSLPDNAFERKDALEANTQRVNEEIAKLKARGSTEYAFTETKGDIGTYSFEKKQFDLHKAMDNVTSFLVQGRYIHSTTMPRLAVSVDPVFLNYVAADDAQAKNIEAKKTSGIIQRNFIQIVKVLDGKNPKYDNPKIIGVLAAVEFYDADGNLLFKIARS